MTARGTGPGSERHVLPGRAEHRELRCTQSLACRQKRLLPGSREMAGASASPTQGNSVPHLTQPHLLTVPLHLTARFPTFLKQT